jgi:hypothetical protein
MEASQARRGIAFEGSRCIAAGDLKQVALKAKEVIDGKEWATVVIFDEVTSEIIELDLRGTVEEVSRRLDEAACTVEGTMTAEASGPAAPRGPGRPKLGVVAREVTLLPRHWEWLGGQPGGASVALRKLVEEARRTHAGKDRVRQSREAAYRFMSAMAGNETGFEEATRALFAGDSGRFNEMIESWPLDVRDHAKRLAAVGFEGLER